MQRREQPDGRGRHDRRQAVAGERPLWWSTHLRSFGKIIRVPEDFFDRRDFAVPLSCHRRPPSPRSSRWPRARVEARRSRPSLKARPPTATQS